MKPHKFREISMLHIQITRLKRHYIAVLTVLICIFAATSQAIDEKRYITTDQITTDMDAYCLTVLKGEKIEKFDLEIISVVKNFDPGRDAILVVGTDERFKKIGPVKGCSGSPVYIDNRLAGALGRGSSFSKDPFYIVTPIEQMLNVGKIDYENRSSAAKTSALMPLDTSQPIDFAKALKDLTDNYAKTAAKTDTLTPIYTSLPQIACQKLTDKFQSLGLIPLAGASTGTTDQDDTSDPFQPGSVITIPLVAGDISLFVAGTVTENVGDKVYALGHHFMGHGAVDLPMATGKIHTVLANMLFSYKIAETGKIRGAIRADEASGIFGRIGQTAKMFPAKITIDRYNAPEQKTYDCQIAVNEAYTPTMILATIMGAAMVQGPPPPEHTVEYKATITAEGLEPFTFQNVSSGTFIFDLADEAAGTVNYLMNNPYKKINITSVDVQAKISAKNTAAVIESLRITDAKIKPGQTINLDIDLKRYLLPKKTYNIKIKLPKNIKPGKYQINALADRQYISFLRKSAPHKLTAKNLPSLINALRNMLKIKRNNIYITIPLPTEGLVIDQKEMPQLPKTKALLLTDTKKTKNAAKYKAWIENKIKTDYAISGKQSIEITIEK